MKRAAIYVRVSTEEQKKHGLSVASQITALEEFCKKNKYKIVNIYNDAGISARKNYKKRPALLDMINDCKNNKIDIVLFTKLDRFFRSVSDYYECINQMNNVHWRAIWEDYETETANGIFKVNIMLSVAQSEADRTSERIKAINEYRRAQGKYIGGNAPTGYIKKDSGIIKDDSIKDAVQVFFDTYASTFSMAQSRNAAAMHGLTIAKATAVRMLHNSAYYGDASGYQCEPYITKEQFDLNNKEMSRFSRTPKHEEYNYYFSGLLICNECGGHYTSKYNYDILKDGTKRMRLGYSCARHKNIPSACSGGYVGQHTLEKYLINNIDELIGNSKIKGEIKTKNKNNIKISKINDKLERIKILFELGDLTIEEYKNKRDSLKAELDTLVPGLKTKKTKLPDNWKEMYYNLDNMRKRAFWHQIIDKILIDKNSKNNPTVMLK